ncbi:hypothetical protein F4804DRAFT_334317 [Jackrogersella minutella]|nr:hypothetical protein F4804DRAFT_334317 [Jackrogersella minutella]
MLSEDWLPAVHPDGTDIWDRLALRAIVVEAPQEEGAASEVNGGKTTVAQLRAERAARRAKEGKQVIRNRDQNHNLDPPVHLNDDAQVVSATQTTPLTNLSHSNLDSLVIRTRPDSNNGGSSKWDPFRGNGGRAALNNGSPHKDNSSLAPREHPATSKRDGSKRSPVLSASKAEKKREEPPFVSKPTPASGRPTEEELAALGDFRKIPAEVRVQIWKKVLVSPNDIPVYSNWTRVYPRKVFYIDSRILHTCKLIHREGHQLLYSDNTFLHDIRDPSKSACYNQFPVLHKSIFGGDRYKFPIEKYRHLIRHVKVNIPGLYLWYHYKKKMQDSIETFLLSNGQGQQAELLTFKLCFTVVDGTDDPPDGVFIVSLRRIMSLYAEYLPDFLRAVCELHVPSIRVSVVDLHGFEFEQIIDMSNGFNNRKKYTDTGSQDVINKKEFISLFLMMHPWIAKFKDGRSYANRLRHL